MYKKLIFVSILWIMSIGLAKAQYSFDAYLGTPGSEVPYNMLQSSDGTFYIIGTNSDGGDYVYKLHPNGSIIWEKSITHSSNTFYDIFEVSPDSIYLGGGAGFQIQELNPTLAIINAKGEVKFNKVYPLKTGTAGSIIIMAKNDKKREIISIGNGGYKPGMNGHSYFFQKTKYDGTLIKYKQIINNIKQRKIISFFKYLANEEYAIWTQKEMIKLDSSGNTLFIKNITDSMQIDTDIITGEIFIKSGDILSVVQNANGTYTSLAAVSFEYFIQLHDSSGKLLKRKVIPNTNWSDNVVFAMNKTAEGGYIFAGSELRLLDSNWNEVWKTNLLKLDEEGYIDIEIRTVAQAADGGFYGCGRSFKNFETRNHDFYVYKTTPTGVISSIQKTPEHKREIIIYPNPSIGIFTIQGIEVKSNAQIKVYDIEGKEITNALISNTTIDLSNQPNGLYYLRVEATTGNVLLKQSLVIAR